MHKIEKQTSRNFLSSLDISKDEILRIFELANNFKNNGIRLNLENKVL